LDIKETKALIEKYFNDIPRGAEVVQPVAELKPLGGEVRETVYDNIQLPGLFVGYRLPEQDHPDAYALSSLSTVLSDGPSSRVTKRMVDQEQVAIQALSFAYSLEDAGVFINLAIANQGKTTQEIEVIFDEEVAKVQNELITEKELQTALNKIENSFVSSVGSMAGVAENLANYHVYYGDAGLINDEIERYRKVTREDIMRVAKQYLVKENRVILEYLPKSAQDQ
jgi:predicted Zn-dependent peptidase